MLSQKRLVELVSEELQPALDHEKRRMHRIDRWYRWEHDKPHTPKSPTDEYQELVARAQAPWPALVVTTTAQQLYLEGYRPSVDDAGTAAWDSWMANGMPRRQIAIHRAALAYGLAYTTVLPGTDSFSNDMPIIRGHSPRRMIAFYQDPAEDDWPAYALRADPAKINGADGYVLRVYDDTHCYRLHDEGRKLTFITADAHDLGVTPVVRYANMLDLEGRSAGEIEPVIPLFGRIDQTAFDRLVVQRYAAFVVRTVTGMAKPDGVSQDEWDKAIPEKKLRLAADAILVAEDPDTKFGSLPATNLTGFIEAHEADVRTLAALTQTPAHEMLGQMANLSAEALAAAEASLTRKVEERKHAFGASHAQTLRLAARVSGDLEAARDWSAEVRWKDMESRSLAQTADALGKLATMLKVPVELLWEKIPGWDDTDVEKAKELVARGGGIEALMRALVEAQTGQQAA